jgi:tetratricopeptide (TPR) repeat protein
VERLNQSISELGIIKVKPLPTRQALDGMEQDFQRIARRLGVAALLRVWCRQVDDDLEINIELINGPTGNLIPPSYTFSEKPSQVMQNVFEIARSVVEKLRPHLGPAELDRLECLMLYCKGRDQLANRNRDSLQTAIGHFQDALKKNPKYALAHVGLAESYNMLGIYGEDDPKKVFPLGKQAAEEASKIDYSLAEAHTSLAFYFERYELNRQASQREYELAIKLGSSKPDAQATTYHRYGVYLLGLGRFQEAIEKIQLAKAANPFSQIMMADLAQPYLYSEDLAAAIRICEATIARFPSFAPAYRYRGLAYEQEGNFTKAIEDLEKAVEFSGGSPLMKGELGHVLASAGKKDRAMSILSELQEQRKTGYSSCFRIAQIYACLGDREAALKHLEQAVDEKDPFLWFLEVDPIFSKKIGDEPRFKQLKDRLARR